MPKDSLHFEPYIHLAGLTDHSALISWGGFFFRPGARGGTAAARPADADGLMVMDDEALASVDPGRRESIGQRSRSYGPARVRVFDSGDRVVAEAASNSANHVWMDGLEPDTEYRYEILVNGRDWLAGERRDWTHVDGSRALNVSGRRYAARFRTHPPPGSISPLAVAVLGDFGIGIRTQEDDARRQLAVARGLERTIDRFGARLVLTTGDNIYLGHEHTSVPRTRAHQRHRRGRRRLVLHLLAGSHPVLPRRRQPRRGGYGRERRPRAARRQLLPAAALHRRAASRIIRPIAPAPRTTTRTR